MKKSLNWFLVGALLAAGSLAMSARAQNNVVYAAEFNQSANRFGTINLLNGNFTQIASIGSTLINDIAYCPTNGMLYGISNTTALVTFNITNGAITTIGSLVSGIESLAFRPSDGVLFGCTQSKLYTINPANGTATSVGSFGSPPNLGTTGQNIRFAQDGNLYVSNTGTNTDIYRVNTTNGAATWMGEAVGYPYLMLENASSNMYGVFVNLGSTANGSPELVTLNLSSFVVGGTNANGSTHQITINLVGPGTNFPANFNFSGNVPQAVTNLTVPVNATGPSNQTTVVGSNVVFSTAASGTGPYNYAWSKNGGAISGQNNSTLTLNNVTTSDAAAYSVIVGGAIGTVTNSATLTVTKAVAIVTLGSLNQTYDGSAKAATATTTPTGLAVSFTYNGSATVPISAGSYTVIGTINDVNYQGSATDTLVINKASSTVSLGSLNQTYDGSAKAATATTTPGGLAVSFTYNGSATVPTSAGSYTVVGTINDVNYQGSATDTLVINKASAAVTLGSLSQTYDGSAKAATATTTPGGLAVSFTYNGSATIPTGAGSYAVVGTINDANYQGGATNTLVISKASSAIALGDLSQTYDGTAKAATATTTPGGLVVSFTYNGSATVPTGAGSYTVIGMINDANYQGSATGTLVIGQATATISLGSLSQNYDGSAKAATATTTPSGLAVNLTYNGSATIPTAAGTYTVVATINDANYQGGATGTLMINTMMLTVTNLPALDKVYDGSTNATLDATNAGLAGVLDGDDVTLVTSNAVAYFADKNVGTDKPVTVTGLALDGVAAANYTLADPTNVTANVTAAGLTVGGVAAVSKVYDATTNAELNGTAILNDVVSGDEVSLAADDASAAFAGPNVGTGLPVTVSGYAITGADAGNYTLTQPSDLAADITAATLTITATANTKIYDGSTIAAATPTISGLQGSDTVTDLAETYDTKNAGAGKTLSVSAYAVNDGNGGNNYTVNTATSTAGVINKAALTITAAANSKIYDSTTSAVVTPTASGLQGSDSVTGLAETYDTKNAGTGKTLSVSAYTVNDGNSGNNYIVSTVANSAGVISQAALTITAAANTKIYDGTTSAVATPTASGLQDSDSVTGLAETYDTKNAGTGKALSVSAYMVNDGNSGNNYIVSTVTSTAGVINRASLTITAAANTKTYDGSTSALATPTISGLQGSDSVTGLVETYDTKNAGTGKTLSVSAYTVNDGNSGNNYTVSTVTSAAGVINTVTLTVTADNKTKICGMPNPPLTASYNGFVGGESADVLSSPVVLNTTATNTSGAGKYPITASGAAAANYTIQNVNGTLQVFSAPQVSGASVSVSGTQKYVVSCPTIAGQTYQLEYTTDNLASPKWTPLGTPFAGTDGIVAVTNSMSVTPQCFFRVEVLEAQ